MTRDEPACRKRQNLTATPRPPRLYLSNLVSVQQYAIAPTPASKRSDLSPRLYPQPRSYRLLYSHGSFTFEIIFLLEGNRKYTKIGRRCQELFSKRCDYIRCSRSTEQSLPTTLINVFAALCLGAKRPYQQRLSRNNAKSRRDGGATTSVELPDSTYLSEKPYASPNFR